MKKLLSILLTLCMILSLFPVTTLAAETDKIPYIKREWENGQLNEINDTISADSVTEVTSDDTDWGDETKEHTWYVARGEITIENSVTVKGNVHLILADGCELTVKVTASNDNKAGINVAEGNFLTIYAQSTGDNMGTLDAGGTRGAGIGGNGAASGDGSGCGEVTIHGGTVNAESTSGAGIGGGGNGGAVTIYGGKVTAKSNNGAGIGGGGLGTSGKGGAGGKVTIYGGEVYADSTNGGIGGGAGTGGKGGDGGKVTIYGGTVTAKGSNGAGIGGGNSSSNTGGDGGKVTISGGTVTAKSTQSGVNDGIGAGIGGGGKYGGGIGGGDAADVTISGGTVNATGFNGAGIGGGGGSIGGGGGGTGGKGSGTGGKGGIITISGGTVTATGKSGAGAGIGGGGTSGDSGTVRITGGSIDASKISGTPKNDDDVELLLTSLKLDGVGSGKAVTTISSNLTYIYGTTDMETDESGKLYLYLPQDTEITSVTTADGFRYVRSGMGDTYKLPVSYTVTINGGGSDATGAGSYSEGDTVSLKAGTKTGYTFNGWTAEGITLGDTTSPDITFTMPANDVTITANWVPVYTVTFNSNGGSTVPPVTGKYGTKISAPEDPSKTGHTFAGWFKDEELTNAWNFTSDTIPDRDIILYAKWTINTHTVTFNSNGGSTVPPVTGEYGTKISAPEDPSKTGYTFAGWYRDELLTFAWDFVNDTMPASDLTLYAKWTANGGGGGGGSTPDPVPTPPPTPTPTSPSTPTPTPTPTDDTFVFTPSIINEMIKGGQNINIDNGLQLLADLSSIPRGGEDAIIVKVSEIRDADALSEFYEAYPTQQALFKGYEVDFIVERENQSSAVTELLDEITLKFQLTPEELQGVDPNTLVVYKEDDSGAITKLYGTFDWATRTYTVTTNHLCNFYLLAETASDETWVNPFNDVKDTDWFYSAVEFVNRNGFYTGTGADTFSPNGAMTRAMFWTVLGRVNGQKLSGADVFVNARTWAMGAGVTDGTDPDANITREQMVTILWRYVGSPEANDDLSKFSDANKLSDYAYDAMVWAVEKGIVQGDNGSLMPQDNATRAQAAAILQRFIAAVTK